MTMVSAPDLGQDDDRGSHPVPLPEISQPVAGRGFDGDLTDGDPQQFGDSGANRLAVRGKTGTEPHDRDIDVEDLRAPGLDEDLLDESRRGGPPPFRSALPEHRPEVSCSRRPEEGVRE